MVRDLVNMAATATERCCVWPKTAAQDVKCVREHCRGAGSSLFRRTDSRKRGKNST